VSVSSVTPAEITYGPLLGEIGDGATATLKDLEVLAGDTPPPDYGFDLEVEGIGRVLDEAGQQSAHLVGFSAGASAALAFAAKYPGRVESLALIEPPFIGNKAQTPEERAFWAEGDEAMAKPPAERMGAFVRMLLRPGVQPPPPPPGPPPPWMAKWPEALKAMHWAFKAHDLDLGSLRGFRKPVYVAVGSLSNPAWRRMAERLDEALPNIEVEAYEGRHHLDAPHVAEPERFANALRELWRRTAPRASSQA
jgi:pimeloyl-ACP methyl ester carboxylesterase